MALSEHWPHQAPRPYSQLEVEDLWLELMDDATAMGHILQPMQPHPTLGKVRLYRCAGCVAVYRLGLPGASSGAWDNPCLGKPLGICPSSFAGVIRLAAGEEGGLSLWGELSREDDWASVVANTALEQGHTGVRYLAGRILGDDAPLFPRYATPNMWQCGKCGRLIATLSNPLADTCTLYLSALSCVGHRAKLRTISK